MYLLLKKIANRYSLPNITIKLLSLILIVNIYACDCEKSGSGKQPSGKLNMEFLSKSLIGADKNIHITFSSATDDIPVDLKDYKLQISFLSEENGIDSKVAYKIYQNGKVISMENPSIEEYLINLSGVDKIETQANPIEVDFTFLPGKDVTKLLAIFRLLDAEGNSIDEEEITWKEEKTSINLVIERTSAEYLQGDNKSIQLKITNQGAQAIVAGESKLKIKRVIGNSAIINKTTATSIPNEYELVLGALKSGELIIEDLTINPEADKHTKFEFCLMHKEKQLANSTIYVGWQKGIELVLKDLNYNSNTQEITYTIENKGTIAPTNLKLEYISKTSNLKLDGNGLVANQQQIKDLTNLKLDPEISIKDQVLGKFDFNSNKSADFQFKLVYEGGSTIVQSHTFNAQGTKLSINKLEYDQEKGKILYNIKNEGTAKAENVKLRYTNISNNENLDGKAAVLEKSTAGTINIGDIAENNGETGDRELALDLKYADEATFKFELLHNGVPITQEEKQQTFNAKPVKLQLVPISSIYTLVDRDTFILTGDQQEIKCKIVEVQEARRSLANIDMSRLNLTIREEAGNNAYISQNREGIPVNKLTANDLGGINNEISLYINTKKASEAKFTLTLEYKDTPIYNAAPIHINWKESTLNILEANNFINNDIASFKLKNLNTSEAIDCKSVTIEITSNNEANFVLLKSDTKEMLSNKTTLDQLTGDNVLTSSETTKPIIFKLENANGKDNATVTIIVKRGTESVSQTIAWENQPTKLQIKFIIPEGDFTSNKEEDRIFQDKQIITIHVTNIGNTINTEKIDIQLINDKGIKFKLGGIDGDNINSSLDGVILKQQLINNETVTTSLHILDNPKDAYCASLTFTISDNQGVLYTEKLYWVNLETLSERLNIKSLKEIWSEANNRFGHMKGVTTSYRNDGELDAWYRSMEEIILFKKPVKNLIDKIEKELTNLIKDNLLLSDIADLIVRKFLSEPKELHASIYNYILEALQYAKKQIITIDKHLPPIPGESDVKKIQEKQQWTKMLVDLANQTESEEATKILKEAKKISEEVGKEIKHRTPIAKEKAKKILANAINGGEKEGETIKKKNRRRALFINESPIKGTKEIEEETTEKELGASWLSSFLSSYKERLNKKEGELYSSASLF